MGLLNPGVSRTWIIGVGAGALACLSLLVLPVDSLAWVLVARGTSVAAVIAFAFANMSMPPRTRQVWWAIWVYAALTVAGTSSTTPAACPRRDSIPGPADSLYLAAYGAALIGLFALVRRVNPGKDRDTWIDTMILTIAVAAAVGYFVAAPTIAGSDAAGSQMVIALAYPFLTSCC